jgi:protein-S-isoprenylcysteine O-methyltransferase Ste14
MGETASLVLRTLLFTIIVPGSVTVLVPYWLVRSDLAYPLPSLGLLRYSGVAMTAVGVAIYLWCAWDFIASGRGTPNPMDAPKRLVSRGLYRWTRNPMYLGVSSIVIGEALLFESAGLFAYAALLLTLFHLRVLTYEEPTLRRLFGASFDDYCRRVPRWLPRRAPR